MASPVFDMNDALIAVIGLVVLGSLIGSLIGFLRSPKQKLNDPPSNVVPLHRRTGIRRLSGYRRKTGRTIRTPFKGRKLGPAISSRSGAGKYITLIVGLVAVLTVSLVFSPARYDTTVEVASENVRVIDADTIAVGSVTNGSTSVRLKGIAAPERGHSTFEQAREFVGGLLRSSEITRCDLTHETTYGRRVGRCYFVDADGLTVDIQRAVVANGYARPCLRYGGWRYLFVRKVSDQGPLPLPDYCIGLSPF